MCFQVYQAEHFLAFNCNFSAVNMFVKVLAAVQNCSFKTPLPVRSSDIILTFKIFLNSVRILSSEKFIQQRPS